MNIISYGYVRRPSRRKSFLNSLGDPFRRLVNDLLPYVLSLQQEVVAPVLEGDQLLVDGLGFPVDFLVANVSHYFSRKPPNKMHEEAAKYVWSLKVVAYVNL